jgi:hypothetical protein
LDQVRFASHARVVTVGIHVAAGVVWIKQVFEHAGVGDGDIRDDDFADQFVALVDAGVPLVIKVAPIVFLGSLGINIHLSMFVGFPFDRRRALFDDFCLFALVPLHRYLH